MHPSTIGITAHPDLVGTSVAHLTVGLRMGPRRRWRGLVVLLLSQGRVRMRLVALHEARAALPGRRRRHVPIVRPNCISRVQAFMIDTSQQHSHSS